MAWTIDAGRANGCLRARACRIGTFCFALDRRSNGCLDGVGDARCATPTLQLAKRLLDPVRDVRASRDRGARTQDDRLVLDGEPRAQAEGPDIDPDDWPNYEGDDPSDRRSRDEVGDSLRVAIVVTAVAEAFVGYLFAWFATTCVTERPDCEPISTTLALITLAVIGSVIFLVVLIAAVLLRSLTRVAIRQRRHWRPAGAAVLAVATFAAGIGVERAGLLGGPPSGADFAIIRDAWGLLHENYVRASDLDSTEMAYAAVYGMTWAVGDTDHTTFLTPDEMAAADVALDPTAMGIGAALDISGDVAVVSSIAAGGPAERAGLRLGDLVLTVDGRSARGLVGAELAGFLGENDGSVVTMSVDRPGSAGRLILEIESEEMRLPVIEWSMIPDRTVALIWIPVFAEGVGDDLAGVLEAVAAADATGIVLDLRGNPGGLSGEAIGTVSQLIASGLVMQRRDADGETREYPVDGDPIDTTTPLVVLIDGDSASTSEMVASALQEAGRATLVGVTTSGTGTVLRIFPLGDGSALWIGITEWLTASGRSVWHTGLEPDIVVAMPDGAKIVRPADLADLGETSLRESSDVQLVAALELIEATAR